MGLFRKKQRSDRASTDDATKAAEAIFNDEYSRQLRLAGVAHFKKLLDQSAPAIKRDMDASMKQVTAELRDHMNTQLDVTITNIHNEITNQLNERISQFNRLSQEAQNEATQSLNRNAQEVYEKYQSFSTTVQQSITSQEVMMISVFHDNKARVAAAQDQQDKALRSLNQAADSANQQVSQLIEKTQQTIDLQKEQFSQINQQNVDQINQTKAVQDKAIESLNASAEALAVKHQQLGQLLDKSVAEQKAMMVDVINENMSRIIEHYLVGALGEQSDIAAQLPSILRQMEQNKQAMVEDMKL